MAKTYAFWALGTLDEPAQQRLRTGLLLPPDPAPTRPAGLRITGQSTLHQSAGVIPPDYRQKLMKNRDLPVTIGELTLTEGRTHQVRRMLRAVGCAVIRLRRVALGPLDLGGLQPGQWRILTPEEEQALWNAGQEQ